MDTIAVEAGESVAGEFAVQVVAGWQKNLVPGIKRRLESLGREMVEESQAIVPVATGRLQESIQYFMQDREQATGRFAFPSLWFGATAPYAAYVEYGHRTIAGTFVEPQPFIRPVTFKNRSFE